MERPLNSRSGKPISSHTSKSSRVTEQLETRRSESVVRDGQEDEKRRQRPIMPANSTKVREKERESSQLTDRVKSSKRDVKEDELGTREKKKKHRAAPESSLRRKPPRIIYLAALLVLLTYMFGNKSTQEIEKPKVDLESDLKAEKSQQRAAIVEEHLPPQPIVVQEVKPRCPINVEQPGTKLTFRGESIFDNEDYYSNVLRCEGQFCPKDAVKEVFCERINCNSEKCDPLLPFKCFIESTQTDVDDSFKVKFVGYRCKRLENEVCSPCELTYELVTKSSANLSLKTSSAVAFGIIVFLVLLRRCLCRRAIDNEVEEEYDSNVESDEDEQLRRVLRRKLHKKMRERYLKEKMRSRDRRGEKLGRESPAARHRDNDDSPGKKTDDSFEMVEANANKKKNLDITKPEFLDRVSGTESDQ